MWKQNQDVSEWEVWAEEDAVEVDVSGGWVVEWVEEWVGGITDKSRLSWWKEIRFHKFREKLEVSSLSGFVSLYPYCFHL